MTDIRDEKLKKLVNKGRFASAKVNQYSNRPLPEQKNVPKRTTLVEIKILKDFFLIKNGTPYRRSWTKFRKYIFLLCFFC